MSKDGSFTIGIRNGKIDIKSSPVGTTTGSRHKDFYVYEWFIKETGEIFYVGKGRKNRYKKLHERAYEAEKIKIKFKTDSRFVAKSLSEDEAIQLESERMLYLLNETNHRLTNRFIPFAAKRGNGYDRSPNTPKIQFEEAPVLYATEIDDHYFGKSWKNFENVELYNLKSVVFIEKSIRDEIDILYDGNVKKYYEEVRNYLEHHGTKVMVTKYAKSVTSWIYIGDDDINNHEIDQEKAMKELGRHVPTYHLLDVLKLLKKTYPNIAKVELIEITTNAINDRVPLKNIKNQNNWEKGFDEGYEFWFKGDKIRKEGNLHEAIRLFDKARYNGYLAPALYRSYAMTYRSLKDYDNEIEILKEGIKRLCEDGGDTAALSLETRLSKAKELKLKSNS